MADTFFGCQRIQLDNRIDFGMAQSEHNLMKRYGLLSGMSDQYKDVTFTKSTATLFEIEYPAEIAGSYTTLKMVKAAIDAFKDKAYEGS